MVVSIDEKVKNLKQAFSFDTFQHMLIKSFPKYQEFYVVHSYLRVDEPDLQARIRKRGQNGKLTGTFSLFFKIYVCLYVCTLGKWCYTHTTRRIIKGEKVETRMQITSREYSVS